MGAISFPFDFTGQIDVENLHLPGCVIHAT